MKHSFYRRMQRSVNWQIVFIVVRKNFNSISPTKASGPGTTARRYTNKCTGMLYYEFLFIFKHTESVILISVILMQLYKCVFMYIYIRNIRMVSASHLPRTLLITQSHLFCRQNLVISTTRWTSLPRDTKPNLLHRNRYNLVIT